jgi:hypothetical protein
LEQIPPEQAPPAQAQVLPGLVWEQPAQALQPGQVWALQRVEEQQELAVAQALRQAQEELPVLQAQQVPVLVAQPARARPVEPVLPAQQEA